MCNNKKFVIVRSLSDALIEEIQEKGLSLKIEHVGGLVGLLYEVDPSTNTSEEEVFVSSYISDGTLTEWEF
ncbi:hypothetical protein K0B03_03865 [Patescibacteria group bacterium]|nr:hypothetical protein [Patescibacteria group bacterium]